MEERKDGIEELLKAEGIQVEIDADRADALHGSARSARSGRGSIRQKRSSTCGG